MNKPDNRKEIKEFFKSIGYVPFLGEKSWMALPEEGVFQPKEPNMFIAWAKWKIARNLGHNDNKRDIVLEISRTGAFGSGIHFMKKIDLVNPTVTEIESAIKFLGE